MAERSRRRNRRGRRPLGTRSRRPRSVAVRPWFTLLENVSTIGRGIPGRECRRYENVAQATARTAPKAHFILVSSLAAAGPSEDGTPVTVDIAPRPVSAYGRSKLQGEPELSRCEIAFMIPRLLPSTGPRETAIRILFVMASLVGLFRFWLPENPESRWLMRQILQKPSWLVRAAEGRERPFLSLIPKFWTTPGSPKFSPSSGILRVKMIPVPAFLIKGAGVIAWDLRIPGVRTLLVFNQEKAHEMLQDAWLCDVTGMQTALGLMKTGFEAGASKTWEWYWVAGWIK